MNERLKDVGKRIQQTRKEKGISQSLIVTLSWYPLENSMLRAVCSSALLRYSKQYLGASFLVRGEELLHTYTIIRLEMNIKPLNWQEMSM